MSDPEFILEQLLELLSVDDDDDNDDDTTANPARPSISNPQILEWQSTGASLAAPHILTAWAPVPLQAERPTERTDQFPAAPRPNCWIGLSVGWPQTDVSLRRFGMVHWSHTPYVTTSSQFALPRTFQYRRTPLGLLNGIPEYDTGSTGTLFYPDALLPLPLS